MGDLLRKERCPKCAENGGDTSGDNLSVYSDGSHCHACGYTARDSSVQSDPPVDGPVAKKKKGLIPLGGYRANTARGISEKACRTMGYSCSSMGGKPCWVANFYGDERKVIAQKVRLKGKEFRTFGDTSGLLWGKQACQGHKTLVITEGEVDALSYREVFPTWDVVSIPNGCKSAAKAIKANLEWVTHFEEVIIAFDNDEPGKEAIEEVVPLFPLGKVKIANLSPQYKDFNDALMKGDPKAIQQARYGAQTWRPDGILSVEQLKEYVDTPVELGVPYPWPTLTKHTFGIHGKSLIVFGAGTGMGKTEFFKEIEGDLLKQGHTVGCIHLEESPKDTCLGIMNKHAGRTFHIPDSGFTEEERDEAFQDTIGSGRLHVYDSFGAIGYDAVVSKMRYMVTSLGCKYVFLDHLTALTDSEEDDRKVNQKMRNIVSSLASLTREIDFTLIGISHLRKASGTPHEEGGRVHLDDLYGAAALKQWASFVFGLERNQQAEDEEERHTTTVRVLKDRYTGRALGRTIGVKYDTLTTRLIEESGGEF